MPAYNFLGKDWYIASEVVREHKLSASPNTYYAKYFCNNRLKGAVKSYEFRLSGDYLRSFKLKFPGIKSINQTTTVWLIDEESKNKLINPMGSQQNTVTIESNPSSIAFHLNLAKPEVLNKLQNSFFIAVPTDAKVPSVPLEAKKLNVVGISDTIGAWSGPSDVSVVQQLTWSDNEAHERIGDSELMKTVSPDASLSVNIDPGFSVDPSIFISRMDPGFYQDIPGSVSGSIGVPISGSSSAGTDLTPKYSEQQISDAIALLSCKTCNRPYQQEKIYNNGAIRIDLYKFQGSVIQAIELKKGRITLDMIKEKVENKNYLQVLTENHPSTKIDFIFSGPLGIDYEALLYLQHMSYGVKPHRVIFQPISSIIYQMLNSKQGDWPPYYYDSLLKNNKIIKHLLETA